MVEPMPNYGIFEYTRPRRGDPGPEPITATAQYAIGSLEMATPASAGRGRPIMTSSGKLAPQDVLHRSLPGATFIARPEEGAPFPCPPCANLRSGNEKTSLVVKPAENLAFPQKNAWSQSQQPWPLVALMQAVEPASLKPADNLAFVQDILGNQLGRSSQDRSPPACSCWRCHFKAADRVLGGGGDGFWPRIAFARCRVYSKMP